jgi:hypothetical protein
VSRIVPSHPVRSNGAPASVGVGTTAADVDRLVAAVAAYVEEGPAVPYAVVEGRWQPRHDPRPLAGLAGADLRAVTRGAGCGPAGR